MGFIVSKNDWRRAAHKCSGMAYKGVTGSPGMFDTRIAYVAEGGVGTGLTKRVAVMDSDGTNHTLCDRGRHHRPDPAPRAGGGQARLRQLRRRHPAGPRPRFREQQPAPAGSDRSGELRPALVAGRQPHRFFDDGRRQRRHLCRRGERRRAPAPDLLARHRHRPELLARRQPDRVRKRPRRDHSSSTS